MPHHFTKSTVEATIFCKTCFKETRWRIMDGRRQYCIECYERRKKEDADEHPIVPPPVEQGKLF